jgi:hypothetical protein
MENAMTIRMNLQICKRIAALLVAAAIVLAAPYAIAVALRSGISSIILRTVETAVSGSAVDATAAPPLPQDVQDTMGPGATG